MNTSGQNIEDSKPIFKSSTGYKGKIFLQNPLNLSFNHLLKMNFNFHKISMKFLPTCDTQFK